MRINLCPPRPPIVPWGIDVVRLSFVQNPQILLSHRQGFCQTCGRRVRFISHEGSGHYHVYGVLCPTCGEDEIELPFPLAMGGTAEWWEEHYPRIEFPR